MHERLRELTNPEETQTIIIIPLSGDLARCFEQSSTHRNHSGLRPLPALALAVEILTVPIYEYRCTKCEKEFEYIQRMSEDAKTTCEECKGALERMISQSAFHLKGGGWYKDLYSSTKKEGSDSKGKESKSSDSGSSGSDSAKSDASSSTSKSESKPSKPAAKSVSSDT